jgi:phosphatidylserine/phosphatidylglycerophosphate/cardiolipin synthase-like enzyme
VFYDPRAVAHAGSGRPSRHARCVTVDERRALLTSANFTEAAQQRNIEAGVLADDAVLALSLSSQFSSLIAKGLLRRLEV